MLVSNDGQVKLVDFGIAKAANQVARTRHGVIKGKYSYMSPEQVRSKPLDGRSDLFAVGILMYEALTAHRPFKRATTVETLKAVIQDLPPDPRRYNAAISKPMVEIIARSLFKKTSRRFADANAMLSALEKALHDQNEPVTAGVISTWVNQLFETDEDRGERTIVLKDIGELLLPDADSVSVAIEAEARGGEEQGIPEQTVISMLGEVQPDEQSGLSGSLSVQVETSPIADNSPTIPHMVHFEARLDDVELGADDSTMISEPPVAAVLEPPDRAAPEPTDNPVQTNEHVGGFRVSADDVLPRRSGPSQRHKNFAQAAHDHRLTLLKFIALGVGIGVTLLVGLIAFSK